MSPPPSRPARLLAMALGVLLMLPLLLEGSLRLLRSGAEPGLPLYGVAPWGGLWLVPGGQAQSLLHGATFTTRVAPGGLRAPAPEGPAWLLLGDSLAFGLGVEGEQTFAALLQRRGLPVENGALPAAQVADLLAAAEGRRALGQGQLGRILLFNPLDDGREPSLPLEQRVECVGGRLVVRGSGLARRLLSSPWSELRLSVELAQAASAAARRPAPPQDEEGWEEAGRRVAERARSWSGPLLLLWGALPEADPHHRAALVRGLHPLPLQDLGEADCDDCQLKGDPHWSPQGHARAAQQLEALLRAAPP